MPNANADWVRNQGLYRFAISCSGSSQRIAVAKRRRETSANALPHSSKAYTTSAESCDRSGATQFQPSGFSRVGSASPIGVSALRTDGPSSIANVEAEQVPLRRAHGALVCCAAPRQFPATLSRTSPDRRRMPSPTRSSPVGVGNLDCPHTHHLPCPASAPGMRS